MPRFAALTIPSPLESVARVQKLRDLSRGREREDQQDLREQQERAKLAEIQTLLQGSRPEQFETDVFPQLYAKYPMEALELRAQFQRMTPAKPSLEEEFFDPATKPARRAEIERQRRLWTAAGREPEGPPTLVPHDPTRPLVNPRTGATVVPGVPKSPEAPASIDAAILAADRRGDRAEVQRLLDLKTRITATGRAPEKEEGRTLSQQYTDYRDQHDREIQEAQEAWDQVPVDLLAKQPPSERPPRPAYRPPLAFEEWRRLRSGTPWITGPRAPRTGRGLPSWRQSQSGGQVPAAPAPPAARVPPGSSVGPPQGNLSRVREEARAALDRFASETDPTRKAALAQRLRALRALLAEAP